MYRKFFEETFFSNFVKHPEVQAKQGCHFWTQHEKICKKKVSLSLLHGYPYFVDFSLQEFKKFKLTYVQIHQPSDTLKDALTIRMPVTISVCFVKLTCDAESFSYWSSKSLMKYQAVKCLIKANRSDHFIQFNIYFTRR